MQALIVNLLSHHAAGSITIHEGIDIRKGAQIEILLNGLFQAGSGDSKIDRSLGIKAF